jgi:hypothetical protein
MPAWVVYLEELVLLFPGLLVEQFRELPDRIRDLLGPQQVLLRPLLYLEPKPPSLFPPRNLVLRITNL